MPEFSDAETGEVAVAVVVFEEGVVLSGRDINLFSYCLTGVVPSVGP
jgi:hypothetical protein